MKVACLGNLNNMLFGLTRYLRDEGIDAEIILLNNEQPHFHPSFDSFTDDYKEYTHQVNWGSIDSYFKTDKQELFKFLEQFQFLIATDDAIPFIHKAGRKIDVIFPAGPDLTIKPWTWKTIPWYAKLINSPLYFFSKAYYNAFKNASCINQENTQELYKNALERLKVYDKNLYFGCPMVYNKPYFRTNDWQSDSLKLFENIRANFDFMVFYHNRLNWFKTKDSWDHNKGTDVLIKGFAHFVHKNPSVKATLVYMKYGVDIEETEQLINDLGITDKVIGLELMPRKDILLGLSLADFGCGQFFSGGLGGGTTWEVLALGKPLIHYLDEEKVSFLSFDSPFPFVNANNEFQISGIFEDFLLEPSKYENIGNEALNWFQRNFIDRSVQQWIELIKVKKRGENLENFVRNKVKEKYAVEA